MVKITRITGLAFFQSHLIKRSLNSLISYLLVAAMTEIRTMNRHERELTAWAVMMHHLGYLF